jgi:hypothetical protein
MDNFLNNLEHVCAAHSQDNEMRIRIYLMQIISCRKSTIIYFM